MKKKFIIVTTLLCVVLIAISLVGPVMSNVEQPKYDVIFVDDNIEMRKYASMVLAEVEVSGARDQAIGNGFRILADYIFGNNLSKQSISMTSPVQQQASEKIAMTAPVQQQKSGNMWKISFVMPSAYSLEALPQPKNSDVQLIPVGIKHFLVIRFSGGSSASNLRAYQDKLMDYVESKKIQTIGPVKFAFYNPPWTLPFMRRNEVMIEARILN